MLKKIEETTSLNQLHATFKQNLSFKEIIIHIVGTNDTAQTLALADIGRVRYEKNGEVMVDAGFDFLHGMSSINGGHAKAESATASDVDIWLSIPRYFNDKNVETVVPSDQAQLLITFNSAFATALASATTRVYVNQEEGVQNYDLQIKQFRHDISGAGDIPVKFNEMNILQIALSDIVSSVLTLSSSNITRVTTQVDEQSGASIPVSSLQANTNYNHRLEAAYNNIAVIYEAEGDVTSRLSDGVDFSFGTSGAATPEVLIISAFFDEDRKNKTRRSQSLRFESKLKIKSNNGQHKTVGAIRSLVGAKKQAVGT